MGDGFLSIDACVRPGEGGCMRDGPSRVAFTYPHPLGVSTSDKSNLQSFNHLASTPLASLSPSACRKHGVRVWTSEIRAASHARHLYFTDGETCSIVYKRTLSFHSFFRARTIRPMRTHPFRMVLLQSISTLTSAVANRLMFACAARERIYLHAFYYR